MNPMRSVHRSLGRRQPAVAVAPWLAWRPSGWPWLAAGLALIALGVALLVADWGGGW
jgi:hypothetical protein